MNILPVLGVASMRIKYLGIYFLAETNNVKMVQLKKNETSTM